jgi:hypothetical protein
MRIRVLAGVAIAAQVVFVASWVVAGAMEPAYSGARSTVSALAARGAAHPWIVVVGLAVLGAGVLALAGALALALPARAASAVAVAAFAVVGAGLVVAAFVRLPCDPAVGPCGGGVHGVAATVAELALVASPFVLAWALSPGPWSRYALVAGMAGLGFAFAFAGAPAGTAERAVLSLGQVWFVVVALGVVRSTGHRGRAGASPRPGRRAGAGELARR